MGSNHGPAAEHDVKDDIGASLRLQQSSIVGTDEVNQLSLSNIWIWHRTPSEYFPQQDTCNTRPHRGLNIL